MITDWQIYLAYRKLKGHSYYDNSALKLKYKIAEWEEPLNGLNFEMSSEEFQNAFEQHIQGFKYFLNQRTVDYNYFKNMEMSIDYEIKSMESINTFPVNYITNYPHKNNLNVTQCNYMADAQIELHLIGVLWIMFLNKYLNRDILYNFNYANRVRPDTTADKDIVCDGPKGIQLSVNSIYFYGYREWRNKALNKATWLLENEKHATIINLDIKRFFYSSRIKLEVLLEENAKRGIIDDEYKNDEDLQKLTTLVDIINLRYTDLIRNHIEEEGLDPIDDGETLLPVGMISSGMIGNLYLTDFDLAVSKLANCEYYGRYVDDMLFVFSDEESINENNPIEHFINKHFVDSGLLIKVNNHYCLSQKKNLIIKQEKIVIEHFDKKGTQAAIKLFKKKLDERSSDFRFILDEDEANAEFELAAYNLEFTDSINKITNIEAFREDKLGASRYLARKISQSGFINSYSKENKDNDKKQILKFMTGRTCLTFSFLWEKVATFFIINRDYDSLKAFSIQAQNAISDLKLSKDAVKSLSIDLIRINTMNYLGMSISMAIALNPLLIEYTHGFNETIWLPKIMRLRRANMFRHIYVGLSCANYTQLIKDNDNPYNLYSGFTSIEEIKEWKANIQFWLSPRFVYLGEISSMCLRIAINTYDVESNRIESVQLNAQDIYNQLNFQWMSFFGGKSHKEVNLFKLSNSNDLISAYETRVLEDMIKISDPKLRRLQCNKNIGIVNIQVKDSNYIDSLYGKPNLSKERKDVLLHILDESVRTKVKTHLLVLPELALPADWLDLMADQSRRKQIGVISGLEYIVKNKGKFALNIVLTILPVSIGKHYKDCILVPRIKNHYSPTEKKFLLDEGFHIPQTKPYYNLFHWRKSYFSVYNCFELASIEDRAVMKGKVDFLVATELNPDTNFYSDIIGSWTRDIHCFVIQVNTSEFGDSRILHPSDSVHKNALFVKGGKNAVVLIDVLNIYELRRRQRLYVRNYYKTKPRKLKPIKPLYIKHTPPNFKEDDVNIRIKDKDFF